MELETARIRKRARAFAIIKKTVPLYLLVLPALVYFLVLTYIPTVYGFVVSFQKYRLVGKSDWIGLANYREAFMTPGFWNAFSNTLILGFGSLLVGIPVSVGTAVLLNEVVLPPFKKTIQSALYLPSLFGWVVIAGLWMYMLAPDYGLVNLIRARMGKEPILFLIRPQYAKPLVWFLGVWRGMGAGAIIYLASISQISPELYESALMDGAGKLRQTLSITLPCLVPTIQTLTLLGITGVFNIFDPVFVLINSGNYEALDVLMYYIKTQGVDRFRMGYASAVSVFVFALIFITTLLTKQTVRYRV